MPWCPNCKSEYEEGYKTCSDCGNDLIGALQAEEKINSVYDEPDCEAFLVSTDGAEADVVESLLNANGIPVLRKYRETGSYMTIVMGKTVFGIDLYVPSKLYDLAREVLGGDAAEPPDDHEQEMILEERSYRQKQITRAWAYLIWPVVSGVIIYILVSVLSR